MKPLFALFLRSLRDDVRARSTYAIRAMLVGFILLLLWITHVDHQWSGAVGREFFAGVLTVNLVVLSLIGLSYFSSAITEEKEDDTLGLLRMTNLSSMAILLGKSTGRLVGGLLFILVQLPFMLLALPMGGLRVVQILAGVSCLLGYTIFLANFGLLASVIFRKTVAASTFAGILLFPLAIGPEKFLDVVYFIPHESFGFSRPELGNRLDAWTHAAPVERRAELLFTNFNGPVFGWQFSASIGAALACFLVAWLSFDTFSAYGAESGRSSLGEKRRRLFPRSRVEQPALAWKDYYFVAGGPLARGIILLLCSGFCVFAVILGRDQPKGQNQIAIFGLTLFFTSAFTALLAISLEASRIFRVECTERTLSSLMGLPISTGQIVWQKIRGCLTPSRPLFIFIAIGAVCIALMALKDFRLGGPSGKDVFYFVCFASYAVSQAVSLPVFVAWLSLRMRWGAFLVGGTLWCIGNWALGGMLVMMFDEASVPLLPVSSMTILGLLASSIPRRLEQLAAEE